MPARVVIADDHPIVLDGLEQLFRFEPELEVVARCRDGDETLRVVRQEKPDLLILDIKMPGPDGLAILRAIRDERIPTRVVLLTAALNDDQLVEAVSLGAQGVVLKETAPRLLVTALHEVRAGRQWLESGPVSRALRKLVQREEGTREAEKVLTPRELEIVRMAGKGLRNRDIAERLYISEGTVKIHFHNIYQKLKINGRLELALYAREKGLA